MSGDAWFGRSLLPQPRSISPGLSSWLDFLRWFAAMLVCISHARAVVLTDYAGGGNLAAKVFYWIHGFGHQAVVVFFVLSGYLVGGEVLREIQRGLFDWRVYTIRRVSRLWPVYVTALLLGALWDNLGLHFFNAHQLYNATGSPFTMIYYSVAERLSPTTFAGNLVFCQTLLVTTFGSNTPLWSLANEAWYYALFPLALWPVFTAAPVRRWVGLGLFAAGCYFVREQILLYFALWLLGLVPHFLQRALAPGWLSLGLLGLWVSAIRFRLLPGVPVFAQDLGIAVLLCLWLIFIERHPERKAPGPAALHRWLASFSYSLYLVHWPLALFLASVLDRQFGLGYRMSFGVPALLLYLVVLVCIYFAAWAVAQLTERNTPRIRAWLLGPTALAPRVATD